LPHHNNASRGESQIVRDGKRASRGKEVVITVHGKETAKLVAVRKRKNATKKNDWPNWMNCAANTARELTGYTSLLLAPSQPLN
jgi:prevent-host-death family protein